MIHTSRLSLKARASAGLFLCKKETPALHFYPPRQGTQEAGPRQSKEGKTMEQTLAKTKKARELRARSPYFGKPLITSTSPIPFRNARVLFVPKSGTFIPKLLKASRISAFFSV